MYPGTVDNKIAALDVLNFWICVAFVATPISARSAISSEADPNLHVNKLQFPVFIAYSEYRIHDTAT